MQLVEQGKLALDDAKLVEKIALELKDVKVIDNGKLVAKEGDITLRMLLAHTAGFGYSFLECETKGLGRPIDYDEFMCDEKEMLSMPRVNQSGKMWEYDVCSPIYTIDLTTYATTLRSLVFAVVEMY